MRGPALSDDDDASFEEVLSNEFKGALGIQLWVADDEHLHALPVLFGGMGGVTADPRVQVLIQGGRSFDGSASLEIHAGGLVPDETAVEEVCALLREAADLIDNPEFIEGWRAQLVSNQIRDDNEEREDPEP